MKDWNSMYDGMNLTDEQRDKFDTFAATLGLGPEYKPKPRKTHECPQCKKHNAYYKEIHPDTDMDDIVLCCSDCGFLAE